MKSSHESCPTGGGGALVMRYLNHGLFENIRSRLPGAGDETMGTQCFFKLTTLKPQ